MAQLSGGQIAGIVIGSLLGWFSAVLWVLHFLCVRRRRKTKAADHSYPEDRKWPLGPTSQQSPGYIDPYSLSPVSAWGGSTQYSSSPANHVGQYSPRPPSFGGSTQYSPAPASVGTPSTYVQQYSPYPVTLASPCYHQPMEPLPQQHIPGQLSSSLDPGLQHAPGKVTGAPVVLPKQVTAEQILHTDKQSQIEEIQHHVGQNSQNLTVALGRTAFDSTKLGAIDETRAINPYELEKKPNPVHFSHLYSDATGEAGGRENHCSNGPIVEVSADIASGRSNISKNWTGDKPPDYDFDIPTESMQAAYAAKRKRRPASLHSNSMTPSGKNQSELSPVVIPYLSPSIATNSDDADMTEPDTPHTSSSNDAFDSTSKQPLCSSEPRPQTVEITHNTGGCIGGVLHEIPTDAKGKSPATTRDIRAFPTRMMFEASPRLTMASPTMEPCFREASDHEIATFSGQRSFYLETSPPSVDVGPSLTTSNNEVCNSAAGAGTLSLDSSHSISATFRCTQCPLVFPTNGKRTDHFNRRHNRRYPCSLCSYRCSLRADMTRHLNTVHSDSHRPAITFQCPNDGCNTTWTRKDHLKRHVQRCIKQRQKMAEG